MAEHRLDQAVLDHLLRSETGTSTQAAFTAALFPIAIQNGRLEASILASRLAVAKRSR